MRILLIDIDTLRPDHMGCYGYYRNTTPHMDRLAGEGVRFDRYYCSDAPCLPSRAALISGMFGIHNGVVGHGGTASDKRLYGEDRRFRDQDDGGNLISVFRQAGMKTASISTFPERHSAWWFNAGFNETYNVGDGGDESGEKVLPVALDWLERNREQKDWMLHVHFWDPHTPYRAPADFGEPFAGQPFETWIDDDVLASHLQSAGPHGAWDLNMYDDKTSAQYPRHPGRIADRQGLRRLFDEYDTSILYTDHLVGQLFDKLRQLGQFEDTAVIVTSDHGETMGELGIYAEHGVSDEATCRIPLIVKWPGLRKGQVDEGFHYNVDLAPTVADLLEVPHYRRWDGASFAQSLRAGADTGRECVILSQMAHVCQRSARFGEWLYIRTYHDGYRLFDREMLFNIGRDPYEQHDVKDRHPEVCARGAKYILDWVDEMMEKSPSQIDPLWTVMQEGGPHHTKSGPGVSDGGGGTYCRNGALPGYLERLRQTGREEQARQLAEKYGF